MYVNEISELGELFLRELVPSVPCCKDDAHAFSWLPDIVWPRDHDDTPRDGFGCDTATTHYEKSVPAQMTLTAFREAKVSTSVHETKSREPTRINGSGNDD